MCMLSLLRPKFGNGVTLLIPSASEKKKITEIVFGDDPEQAIPMLQSIVLFNYLPTPATWQSVAHTDRGIMNAARHKLDISVDKAGDIEVAGVKIIPNKSFITFADRKNIAVWNMSAGKLPLEGKVIPKSENVRSHAPKSQYGGADQNVNALRYQYAEKLSTKFNKILATKPGRISRCYLKAVVSIVGWYKSVYPEVCKKRILPLVGPNPKSTFFKIVFPYSKKHENMPDNEFEEFYAATQGKVPKSINLEEAYVNILAWAAEDTTEAMLQARARQQEMLLRDFYQKAVLGAEAIKPYGSNVKKAYMDELSFMGCIFDSLVIDMTIAGKNKSITDQNNQARIEADNNGMVYYKYIYGEEPVAGMDVKPMLSCINQAHNNETSDIAAFLCKGLAFVRTPFYMHIPVPFQFLERDDLLGSKDLIDNNQTVLKRINQEYQQYKMLSFLFNTSKPQIYNDNIQEKISNVFAMPVREKPSVFAA